MRHFSFSWLSLLSLPGCLLLPLGMVQPAHTTGYKVTDVTALTNFGADNNGVSFGVGYGLSSKGQVVGYAAAFDASHNYLGNHAFLYANGHVTDLSTLADLGTDSTGASWSYAYGINDNGQVVGHAQKFDANHNFVWDHGYLGAGSFFIDLNTMGNFGVNSAGVSGGNAYLINNTEAAGQAYVYDAGNNYLGRHAFLFTKGAVTDLNVLGNFGSDNTGAGLGYVNGLNNLEQAVGVAFAYDASHTFLGMHGFLYDAGSGVLTDLNTLKNFGADPYGATYLYAEAINDRGQIAVEASLFDASHNYLGEHAFLYDAGAFTDLNPMNIFGTDPNGASSIFPLTLNINKQVIGYAWFFDASHNYLGDHAFVYSKGSITDLSALGNFGTDSTGASYCYAYYNNASGQVLGEASVYDSGNNYLGEHAFLYANGQVTDLNTVVPSTLGFVMAYPDGINKAGQILVNGVAPDGSDHIFLLTPIK